MTEIIIFLFCLLIAISVIVLFDNIDQNRKLEINHYEKYMKEFQLIHYKLSLIDNEMKKEKRK